MTYLHKIALAFLPLFLIFLALYLTFLSEHKKNYHKLHIEEKIDLHSEKWSWISILTATIYILFILSAFDIDTIKNYFYSIIAFLISVLCGLLYFSQKEFTEQGLSAHPTETHLKLGIILSWVIGSLGTGIVLIFI